MIVLNSKSEPVRDINAKPTFEFLPIKQISAWKGDEYFCNGTLDNETHDKIKYPCLIIEVIDEEHSTRDNMMFKAVEQVPITIEIYDFLLKHADALEHVDEGKQEDSPYYK